MAEDEKSTRQLADEKFAQFEQTDPERARLFRAEMNEIMCGNFRSIEFDLDPLTAFYLATALDLALAHPQHPDSTRAQLDRVYEGWVERITPQFPEMGRLLADGYRQRRLSVNQTPAKHPDTARLDWLVDPFMGADLEAGRLIGLPAPWNDLRAAVDEAIEEGR